MIKKIGIDIVKNSRIKLNKNFIDKLLTNEEKNFFNNFSNARKKEFLAGRWAVKEAILKSLNSSKGIALNQLNISYINETPVITNESLSKVYVSISHEKKYSIGMAVNESD